MSVHRLESCWQEAGTNGLDGRAQTFLSSMNSVMPLVEAIAAAMAAAGYSERDVFGVRLALEEAIVNGIKHGNRNDPAKRVRVAYWLTPERFLAEVEDEGSGFNPETVPDPTALENLDRPCGRGLLLMRCYTTWMRFNDRGNRVTLCKQRGDAPV
jgi:serine/threonine-protein kinase RsbW